MFLSDLLEIDLSNDCLITGLSLDSRVVSPGDLFFAITGTQTDGKLYINMALQRGAVAIVKQSLTFSIEILPNNIPCINLPNLSECLGEIAAKFYHNPSQNMSVIGITGTNGKTSTAHAIAHILQSYAPCGLFGTLGYGIYGNLQPASHTTPHAISLQALFAKLKQQQVSQAVMEVSSHALVQGRVSGVNFETAVLTNLSRDHLDYHKTMTAYSDAKRILFSMPNLKNAVVNYDDEFGRSILAELPTALTYSIQDKMANVYAKILSYNTNGCQLSIHSDWGSEKLHSPWLGHFNVSNILAILTTLLSMDIPLHELINKLTILPTVPGRMERIGSAEQVTAVVDYAHTPDALEKALLALSEHLQDNKGNIWCVFGCGGDRDRGKRELMGEIAQLCANKIVITDDNPRHESSQAIIDDILQGCPTPTAVIPDRKQAIEYALQNANVNDVVLIAGKGHEDYQLIGDKRLSLSDREIVKSILKK
ncbi:UDP-N-acetylmuramoyl-L-alanyl-D-glutamate--2,6-diaminopimelate ligase [Candidatus Halobeggiatoa sp. HSG11]|nr:UDP-N-acetylmuramoyl-L-alanyl-D-glutamate--2,6-diaminopimelate ligase [Candidatus Halobeggiatoa sp. HSG11]